MQVAVLQVVLVLLYLGLNSGLNMLNRYALSTLELRFPIMLTAAHMLFGFVVLSPAMFTMDKYSKQHNQILKDNGRGLCLVGVLNAVQIAGNNSSIAIMEVSMNQVIRSCFPVPLSTFSESSSQPVPVGPDCYHRGVRGAQNATLRRGCGACRDFNGCRFGSH